MGKHFLIDWHICTSFIAFPMQLEKVDVISFYYSGILYIIWVTLSSKHM